MKTKVLICSLLLIIVSAHAGVYEVEAVAPKMIGTTSEYTLLNPLESNVDIANSGFGDLDDEDDEQVDSQVSNMEVPGMSTTPIGNVPWEMIIFVAIGWAIIKSRKRLSAMDKTR